MKYNEAKGQRERIIARRAKALDLRIGGMRYRQIAEALGVDLAVAFRDVQSAISELDALTQKRAERLRDIELSRCDRAIRALQPGLTAENPKVRADSVRALMAVMDRRAKLLGLDAPTQVNVEGEVTSFTLTLGTGTHGST